MKLQISFDGTNLDKAIECASEVSTHADIIEVGIVLIYNYGIQAVKRFREAFPEKIILADTKIVDQGKESAELFANASADWITVMAGTAPHVIHATTTAAHNENIKVMLDLTDSSSIGQSALEAKNIGADALLFHQPYKEQDYLIFLEELDMIKGNTKLPITISVKIDRNSIDKIIAVKPDTIIVSANTENHNTEIQYFADLIKKL